MSSFKSFKATGNINLKVNIIIDQNFQTKHNHMFWKATGNINIKGNNSTKVSNKNISKNINDFKKHPIYLMQKYFGFKTMQIFIICMHS